MSNRIGGHSPEESLQMLLMKVEGQKDDASSATNNARDLMEALNPANVLGGIAQVIKALGSISG